MISLVDIVMNPSNDNFWRVKLNPAEELELFFGGNPVSSELKVKQLLYNLLNSLESLGIANPKELQKRMVIVDECASIVMIRIKQNHLDKISK